MRTTTPERGSVSGVIIAGVSIATIIAAVIGLIGTSSPLSQESQAQVSRSDVRLVKDTISVTKVEDKKLRISGDFCYGRFLDSGGRESWTIYPTDQKNKQLRATFGSEHLDTGVIDITSDETFPAECQYSNEETGEAMWDSDENLDKKQPHTFSISATLPDNLSADYCPTIYLHYRGTWFDGMPFASVDLKSIQGLCGENTGGSNTPTGTIPLPDDPIGGSTLDPVDANDNAIAGYVSIHGCKEPDSVNVYVCEADNCAETEETLYFNADGKDKTQAVWRDDSNEDGTYIYMYSIDNNLDGNKLDSNDELRITKVSARYGSIFHYSDLHEGTSSLYVKQGDRHDFDIRAENTCGCEFQATGYIKDANGNYLSQFDNKVDGFGLSNNQQSFLNSTAPAAGFTNGQVKAGPLDLSESQYNTGFGYDALTNVKLHSPGYRVLKQECQSTGETDACPYYQKSYTQNATDLVYPNIFEGIRVACGVNVEYGWVVEEAPEPTPAPTTTSSVEVETFMYLGDDKNDEGPDDNACNLNSLRALGTGNNVYQYKGKCTYQLYNDDGTLVSESNELERCGPYTFTNVNPGSYTVRVKSSMRVDEHDDMTPQCPKARSVEVKAGEKAQAAIINALNPKKCDVSESTTTTGTKCTEELNGTIQGRYTDRNNSVVCCAPLNRSEQQPTSEQGQCVSANNLICTGDVKGDISGSIATPSDVCSWYANQNSSSNVSPNGYGWCSSSTDQVDACCYIKGKAPRTSTGSGSNDGSGAGSDTGSDSGSGAGSDTGSGEGSDTGSENSSQNYTKLDILLEFPGKFDPENVSRPKVILKFKTKTNQEASRNFNFNTFTNENDTYVNEGNSIQSGILANANEISASFTDNTGNTIYCNSRKPNSNLFDLKGDSETITLSFNWDSNSCSASGSSKSSESEPKPSPNNDVYTGEITYNYEIVNNIFFKRWTYVPVVRIIEDNHVVLGDTVEVLNIIKNPNTTSGFTRLARFQGSDDYKEHFIKGKTAELYIAFCKGKVTGNTKLSDCHQTNREKVVLGDEDISRSFKITIPSNGDGPKGVPPFEYESQSLLPLGIVPAPAALDLDGNGVINVIDLTIVFDAYTTADRDADVNDDGIVDIHDVTLLIDHIGERIEE